MPIAAANEGGGAAGAGVGLGAGLAMAQQVMGAMKPGTQPAQTTSAADAATKFCLNCGKSIARQARFCPECGTAQP
jgi:membrane protease subunit (stomatin/prohibitin family)